MNGFAQHRNVRITTGFFPKEPSIAIDPSNLSNLVVGTNINNIFYSNDSGMTWQKAKLYSDYGIWGDPCIVAGRANEFFYFQP